MRGYFFIASAAFLWGVSAALGRAVFTGKLLLAGEALHPIDPLILSQTRTSFSLVVLLAILIGRSGRQRIRMPIRDLSYCLVLGVLGVAVSNYFYYVAIQRTSVAIAIILQYTAPVWVLLYVVIRGQQKPSVQKIAAVAVAIAGIVLTIGIVGGSSGAAFRLDTFGVIAGLVASFSFAFYNVAGHRVLARYDRWRVLTWTLVAASVFWLVFNPPWKVFAAHYTAAQWTFLFVFSMISVLSAFSFYFLGLQYLEPTRAIIVSCLEPVFSILLAAMFLSEGVRPVQTLGIVLVLAAIVLVQLPGSGREDRESAQVDPIE
ncbi:MAG: DMT family transporter [Candidatus Sulfotelmatobacter sp.]